MKTTPIIIEASQFTQDKKILDPLDPIALMEKVCQDIFKKTGIEVINNLIDGLYVTNIQCRSFENPLDQLSELLNIKPDEKYYSPIGGNMPQMQVNRASRTISSGKRKMILITGGESYYSVYREKKGEIKLNWPKSSTHDINQGKIDFTKNMSEFERTYKLFEPYHIYALFETALRAAMKMNIIEHAFYMGKTFEKFSRIASKNPYAWNQIPYSTEEIALPSSNNRIICHPFNKREVSNLFVDQSAALLITSERMAEELGVNQDLWIYPMGGADLENIKDLTRRPTLYESPAIREASCLALKQAGLSLRDISCFDLYSCFPCMVEIARKEIGIPTNDSRDLTITGGLSFFGGPFNNYSMHAIVSAVDLIRDNHSAKVMVTANGGYNTKQSIGIYGKEPPAISWIENNGITIQEEILSYIMPEPIEKASGMLKIEGYTIFYNRKGDPKGGLVVGRVKTGERTISEIKTDKESLKRLAQEELVGREFRVKYDPKIKRNFVYLS